MTLVGAAVLPSAPLLVPGIAATLPDGLGGVCDAVDVVVERLPDHRAVLLVAAGDDWEAYSSADASLASIGRADVARRGTLDRELLDRLSGELGWRVVGRGLPLDLGVLALLLGNPPPLVGLSVPVGASFAELAEAGQRLADIVTGGDGTVVVVSAGDLSAGLGGRSPLHTIDGAQEFDGCVVEAVDGGRLDALERLGPERAQQVGARGWAPMSLLHGLLQRSKLGLVRRMYAAPRGVGYLVAFGA